MSGTQRTILVFGATGQQGGAVVRALLRAKWAVRALVRNPTAPRSMALRDAGVELVRGSFADSEVIRSAMRDVHGVFSVLPGSSGGAVTDEEEVRFGIAIADLAAESGIAHLVYSSGASVGEKPTGVGRFDTKPRIEAHIRGLPVCATIVRPMIFMEMLVRPGLGLDEGRFSFFLGPDQPMQLIAVDDIGRFVAAIFAEKTRFEGKTLKLASDTVTGRELEAAFTEAAGRPITYARFSEEVLAAHPDLREMAASLVEGPLADHVDLNLMRDLNPELLSFRSWLAGRGREDLARVLGTTSRGE
ncbi:MAG: NmrA/HSCARG family protein [Cystobacter sp.]